MAVGRGRVGSLGLVLLCAVVVTTGCSSNDVTRDGGAGTDGAIIGTDGRAPDFDAGIPWTEPPLAPEGLTAIAGDTQVIAHWRPTPHATSFRLYWDTNPGIDTTDAAIEVATSPHQHLGLTNGTTYFYAVSAVNEYGESPLSNEASATPTNEPLAANWYMAAANPERSSWVLDPAVGDFHVEWHAPIEAYIDQKTQVIAAGGLLYISTSRGLVTLVAETGDVAWRFDTELPLGHSPSVDVARNVVYVGGHDRRLHALDAATGRSLWAFEGATAGFDTNPLLIDDLVILGNRDGTMYAIGAEGSPRAGTEVWRFAAGGAIHTSAAHADGIIYFAADDNYAYALRVADGSLVWRSDRLLGDGFHSFWPLIFGDHVIFSGARVAGSMANIYEVARPWPAEMEGAFVGDLLEAESWSNGFPVIFANRIAEYYEDDPAPLPYHHKPWHRTLFVLDRNDGHEYTYDSDRDGHREYAPFGWWGTNSGNRYPPITDLGQSLMYAGNVFTCCSDAKGKVNSWSPANPAKVGLVGANIQAGTPNGGGGWAALAEPQALSGAGTGDDAIIYRSLCCDRVGDWFATRSTGERRERAGQFWSYNLGSQIPGYDSMWTVAERAISRHIGWYSGTRTTVNGMYHSHGDQNPIVPHRGRVYVHRSNAIIAFGPGPSRGELPLVPIVPANDEVHAPSTEALRAMLDREVQKILDVEGHLRPGYMHDALHNYQRQLGYYFENPGDTLLTLAMAYPHVSDGVKAGIASYVTSELLPDYFDPMMIARTGWQEGSAREAMPIPDEVWEELAGEGRSEYAQGFTWRYPQHNFYGMYLAARDVPGVDARRLYDLAKTKLQVPAAVPMEGQIFGEDPFQHNAWLTGYYGFLALQELAGMAGTDSALRSQVTAERDRLLTLRFATFDKDSPWTARNMYYKKALDLARNFMYLCPELGEALRDNLRAPIDAAYDEYEYVAPYWFVGRYEAMFGESTIQNPYTPWAMFQGKAYIYGQSRDQLYRYVDAPQFQRGDLFYIQNLSLVIAAP